MQLLKITTIPLEYDLNIQNAKLTAPQIEPAKLSQHTTPGGNKFADRKRKSQDGFICYAKKHGNEKYCRCFKGSSC